VGSTGSVERDGFSLNFVREGHGVPMLVVGSELVYRRAFPEALRDEFEIVFCNLRCWVPSPTGFDASSVTRDTNADDVEAIRQAAELDQPIVVGHSIHGSIVLDYARRYADRLRGVVAIAPSPVAVGELWTAEVEFFDRDASHARRVAHEQNLAANPPSATLDTSEEFIDRYVANGAQYWFNPRFDSAYLWDGVEVNLPLYMRLFDLYGDQYRVESLDVPTLLALGRYDYTVPFHLWDDPKERFANLRYRLYDRSGHTPPLEQPQEFTADIKAWARSL
jgi:proline iminopeptidase